MTGDQGVRYSSGDSGTEDGGLMPGYFRVRGLMMSFSSSGFSSQELRVLRSTVAIGEMRSSVELPCRGVDVSANSVASRSLLSRSQSSVISVRAV